MNWIFKFNYHEKSIIKWAILSRIAIFLLSNIIVHYLINPYDTSSHIQYNITKSEDNKNEDSSCLSKVDCIIRNALYIHASWDSIYFTTIAKSGYVYEQFHAFFPLYPMLIRYFSNCMSFFFFTFNS